MQRDFRHLTLIADVGMSNFPRKIEIKHPLRLLTASFVLVAGASGEKVCFERFNEQYTSYGRSSIGNIPLSISMI